METKRQLREQILHLKHRVEDLEERLCPCESHQWQLTGTSYSSSYYSVDTIYHYKCSRCGKKTSSMVPFQEVI